MQLRFAVCILSDDGVSHSRLHARTHAHGASTLLLRAPSRFVALLCGASLVSPPCLGVNYARRFFTHVFTPILASAFYTRIFSRVFTRFFFYLMMIVN